MANLLTKMTLRNHGARATAEPQEQDSAERSVAVANTVALHRHLDSMDFLPVEDAPAILSLAELRRTLSSIKLACSKSVGRVVVSSYNDITACMSLFQN